MSLAAGAVAGPFGRVALLDIDRPVQAHAHPHAHVLFKVAGADSWFRVRDRLCPLTDETAILVDSWEVHDYPHGAADPKSLILALYIKPEWLRAVDGGFHACSAQGFFPQPCVAVTKGLGKLFHDTADSASDDATSPQDHETLLAQLMCEVVNLFSDWRRLRPLPGSERLIARDFRIRRAIELMRRSDGERCSMDQFARDAALSRAHFFELFKSNTGMSPLVFKNSLKMETSHHALLSGAASLGQIASGLGFSAPGHFTRFFRDHLGVAPFEFRRALRRGRDIRSNGQGMADF